MTSTAPCSREGCTAIAHDGLSRTCLRCARCDNQQYCSIRCQQEDRFTGHGPCVLDALRQAACSRPLTADEYQQASCLLAANTDNPTLRCATLHVLATALSRHRPSDPTTLPKPLFSTNLIATLPTILDAGSVHPLNPNRSLDPHHFLLADAIGAFLNAILVPPFKLFMSEKQLAHPSFPRKHAPWLHTLRRELIDPLGLSNTRGPNVNRTLLSFAMATLPSSGEVAYQEAAAAAAQLAQASREALPGNPGAEALLAAGSLMLLQVEAMGTHAAIGSPCSVVPDPSMAHLRLVTILEREMGTRNRLPHVGLPMLLTLVTSSDLGVSTKALLQSKRALTALAWPLESLAADAKLWRDGTYWQHTVLLQRLLEDMGEHVGRDSIEVAAAHWAQPAVRAIEALWEPDSAGIQQTILGVLACMICTSPAISAVTAPGRLSRWLVHAVHHRSTGTVLAKAVLRVLQGVVHACDGERDTPQHTFLQLARKEVASKNTIEALKTLLEASTNDKEAKCRIVTLLYQALVPDHMASLKPMLDPLLDAFKPCAAPAGAPMSSSGTHGHHSSDTGPGEGSGRGRAQRTGLDGKEETYEAVCQLTVQMAFSFYYPDEKGPGKGSSTRTAKAHLERIVDTELGWLQVFAAGGNKTSPTARTMLFRTLGELAQTQLLTLDHVMDKSVITHLVALLPWLVTDTEWTLASDLIGDILKLCISSDQEGDAFESTTSGVTLLGRAMVQQEVLEALLGRIADKWGVLAGLAAPSGSGAVPFALPENDSMEHLQRLVTVVALAARSVVWVLPQQQAAALRLMQEGAVWELAVRLVERNQKEDKLTVILLHQFLFLQVMNHQGKATGNAAMALLQGMDQRVVLQQLEMMPMPMQILLKCLGVGRVRTSSQPRSVAGGSAARGKGGLNSPVAAAAAGGSSASKASSSSHGGGGGVGGGSSQKRSDGVAVEVARSSRSSSTATSSSAASRSEGGVAPGKAGAGGGVGLGGGGTADPQGRATCSVCLAQLETVLVCSGCRCVRYCTAVCQRTAWKEHKKVCKQLQAERAATADCA